ncbi:MAG: collagen binding domain-containing protein [Clostridia bacterium]
MKLFNKITTILMISILFFNIFLYIGSTSIVKASVAPAEKADLYSKGEVVLFNYDNIGIGVEVIVYQKDGKEYPVYCLNKGRPGVTTDFQYSVTLTQMLANQKVWRAITNGYPFKTPKELGCETMQEAYAATKMAVYDTMYNYDLSKFTNHNDLDSNRRVVNAIKQIITNARESQETKVRAALEIIDETKTWQVDENDKNYVSKTYSVKASALNENYTISLSNIGDKDFKVTDINNNEKSKFISNEKFKILLQISELEKAGDFIITAESSLKTLPIFYGESPNQEWQNFAVSVGEYEFTNATLKQSYQENKTKIEIQKQDGDTKTPLVNGVFNLLDENKQILYSELTSNELGIIELDYLLPGKYYLEEVAAPEGYYGYEDIIPVEIKLNEKVIIKVDNYQEQEEKPDEEPPQESQVSVGEKKLPKTGF